MRASRPIDSNEWFINVDDDLGSHNFCHGSRINDWRFGYQYHYQSTPAGAGNSMGSTFCRSGVLDCLMDQDDMVSITNNTHTNVAIRPTVQFDRGA